MQSVVVTALYDINRQTMGDGRSIDEYLCWLNKTLELNIPIIIYTEKKLVPYILTNNNNQVQINIQELDIIPYFKYKNSIDSIIHTKEYKEKVRHPHRIECNLSLYNIIQYSKFEWLSQTSNFIDADLYFWMDAGCSRFFDDVDLNQEWPKNYSILRENKFNIQGNIFTKEWLENWPGDENYMWDSRGLVVGTLFGGSKLVCQQMAELVKLEFETLLNKNIVNNEQLLLSILLKRYPELFNVYINLNGQHLPFFKDLSL